PARRPRAPRGGSGGGIQRGADGRGGSGGRDRAAPAAAPALGPQPWRAGPPAGHRAAPAPEAGAPLPDGALPRRAAPALHESRGRAGPARPPVQLSAGDYFDHTEPGVGILSTASPLFHDG